MNILDQIINIPGFGINSKLKPAQLTKFLDKNILRNLVETSKSCRNIFRHALNNKKIKYDICKQANQLQLVMDMPKLMICTHIYLDGDQYPSPAFYYNGEFFKDRYTLYSKYDATYKNIRHEKINSRSKYILNTSKGYFGEYEPPFSNLFVQCYTPANDDKYLL